MGNDHWVQIGIITIGASTFASSTLQDNVSFARSEREFVDQLFCAAQSPPALYDCFDKDYEPKQLVRDVINDFLRKHRDITDLVIYYCGHGKLSNTNGHLMLALKTTLYCDPFDMLDVVNFQEACKDYFVKMRVYWVLDCCFAGAAVRSRLYGDIKSQSSRVYPRSGVAMLMAAPSSTFAKSFEDENLTGALTASIREGIGQGGELISFRDVFKEAETKIKEQRGACAPIPEIFPRGSHRGDIA